MGSPHPWLDIALSEIGTREAPGPQHNPVVLTYFEDVGHGYIRTDETAWCAAAMGSWLKRAGYPLPAVETNLLLLARSYLSYGKACAPKVGAIGIWPRGKEAWQGHVGIVAAVDHEHGLVRVVGGNQANSVSVVTLPISTALAFRWPVRATVAELRKAKSREIRLGDGLEMVGVGGAAGAAATAAVVEATREASPPLPDQGSGQAVEPLIAPDTMTYLDQLTAISKAIGSLVASHPWLAAAVIACLAVLVIGRRMKQRRVRRAEAGVPLSVEVVGK